MHRCIYVLYIILNTAKNTAKLLLDLVNNCDNMSENKGKIKMASILKWPETNEEKGDHNHHNRSYKVCITTTGKKNHMKHTTPKTKTNTSWMIPLQPVKHSKTDLLDNILTQLDKQPFVSYNNNNPDNGQTVATAHLLLQLDVVYWIITK